MCILLSAGILIDTDPLLVFGSYLFIHYFLPSSYALVPLQHHFTGFSLCSSVWHLNTTSTTASSWVTSYQDALVLIALLWRFNKKLFYPFMFKNLFLRSSLCLCVVARSVIKIFISLVAAHFISCRLTLDCVKSGSNDWRGPIGVPQRTVWFVLTTLRQTALWDRLFRDLLFVVNWSQVLCLLYFQWSRRWTTVTFTIERYFCWSELVRRGMFHDGYGQNVGAAQLQPLALCNIRC